MLNYNNTKRMSFNSESHISKDITEHGNYSPVEDEDIIIIGTTPAISTSFSPIGINIIIPQKNRFSERKIIIIVSLVDNIINIIINQNLLLFYCFIDHNMLNTTNFNIIVRIEEYNNLVPKMIMIEIKWKTHYSIGKQLLCNK